ncbi:MAG: hypothetical protein KAR33_14050 [Candidatus Thorarchaeota archaeon]|nr:hypothetical protein [Candidatus Thorarchaeota archaeon]
MEERYERSEGFSRYLLESITLRGRADDTEESGKEEAFIFLPKPVNNAKPDNRIQLRHALQVPAFPIRGECIPIPHTRE